jgi:MFS family permease
MEKRTTRKNADPILFSTMTACISSLTFGLCMTSVGCYYEHAMLKFKSDNSQDLSEFWFDVAITGFPFLGAFLVNAALWNLSRSSPRKMLILNTAVYSLATALVIFSLGFLSLVVARLLVGVGLGITCSAVPAYIFSIAPSSRRGFYLNFHSISICFGLFCGSLLNYFDRCDNWKYAFFSILIVQGLHLLFLMLVGDTEAENTKNTAPSVSITRLLLNPQARKSFCLTALIHLGQHLSGVDYMSNRAREIFSGNPKMKEVISYGFMASTLSAALAGGIIDRFGRKFLLTSSVAVLAVTTALLGLRKYEPLAFMLFMAGFNLGLAGIPWFLTFEIFPPSYAAAAGQLGASVNWLSAFVMATTSTILHKTAGDVVYFAYSASMVSLAIFIIVFFKETKGKLPAFQ